MRVTGLFIYPVKGCRGIALSEGAIDHLGFIGDRRFMVVEPNGNFLTQRSDPRLAMVETALTANTLILSAPQFGTLQVARREESAPLLRVKVWSSEDLAAEDCGEIAAKWLSAFLGRAARLVRIGDAFQRPILKATAQIGDQVSFVDGYPFLVISEASLADLNDRLDGPVPMDRFRPNLVVDDCAAFTEDTWARVKIGATLFRAGGPCARCIVTTIDQITGQREKEPLRTLAMYRRDPYNVTNVNFGLNLLHETKSGTIKIGDTVELLEARTR